MLLFFASPLASKSWAQALVVPLFVAFAAAGIFPLWKGIQLYGWERMDELTGLRWGLASGFVYLASLGPFMVCSRVAQHPTIARLTEDRRNSQSAGSKANLTCGFRRTRSSTSLW